MTPEQRAEFDRSAAWLDKYLTRCPDEPDDLHMGIYGWVYDWYDGTMKVIMEPDSVTGKERPRVVPFDYPARTRLSDEELDELAARHRAKMAARDSTPTPAGRLTADPAPAT